MPSARIEVYRAGRGSEPPRPRGFVDPFPNLPQTEWRRRMLALSAPEPDAASLSAEVTSSPKPLDRTPTLAEFIRHAELFGTVCVYETAETYLTRAELSRLQIEVDAIEAATKGRRFATRKRRRRPRRETQNAVSVLATEGFTTLEIAEKLGVRPETVLKYREPLHAPGSPVRGA